MRFSMGTHTRVIDEIECYLINQGWSVLLHDFRQDEFSCLVDFNKKRISSNIPKAWAMRDVLVEITGSKIECGTYKLYVEDDCSISMTKSDNIIVPVSLGGLFNVRDMINT